MSWGLLGGGDSQNKGQGDTLVQPRIFVNVMGSPRRVALGQQPRVEITLPKISHVPLCEAPQELHCIRHPWITLGSSPEVIMHHINGSSKMNG